MNAVVLISFVLFASALAITGDECLKQKQIEQDNLKIVLTFYDEAFGQHDITSVDRYISPNYIQHNPNLPDGPDALKGFLMHFNANKTKGPVDIRHTAVNGNEVWVHLKTEGLDGKPLAIIGVFLVQDGKIVEHWDVLQTIPPLSESKNPHPLF